MFLNHTSRSPFSWTRISGVPRLQGSQELQLPGVESATLATPTCTHRRREGDIRATRECIYLETATRLVVRAIIFADSSLKQNSCGFSSARASNGREECECEVCVYIYTIQCTHIYPKPNQNHECTQLQSHHSIAASERWDAA